MPNSFNKRIAEAAHTLEKQFAAFRAMVQNKDAKTTKAWADTVPHVTEEEAKKRLNVMKDKWNRQGGTDA